MHYYSFLGRPLVFSFFFNLWKFDKNEKLDPSFGPKVWMTFHWTCSIKNGNLLKLHVAKFMKNKFVLIKELVYVFFITHSKTH